MLVLTFTAVLGAVLGAAANAPVSTTLNSTGDFPTDYYGVDVSQPVRHRELRLMLKVIALLRATGRWSHRDPATRASPHLGLTDGAHGRERSAQQQGQDWGSKAAPIGIRVSCAGKDLL